MQVNIGTMHVSKQCPDINKYPTLNAAVKQVLNHVIFKFKKLQPYFNIMQI